ncbi:AAA family ATPase [Marinitoga aeolica]|uniref:AAA family ATPase n=1 Tax=Marinitoga aeolica TaxID=2809031 RepID=UPI0024798DD2|nr:AAA family ATPase [Marinitoga aeolica]
MKRLPIGRSDFKSIIEDNMYYIDKSMLIKEIIESGDVILITRPRRFGKTLNMSMMKYFFRNDQDNKYLFEGLKIWNEKEIIEKYLNKYPVIYLTFKDAKQNKLLSMKVNIKNSIKKIYDEHNYLLDSDVLSEIEKINFKQILEIEEIKGETIEERIAKEDTLYENSLKNLSEYLYRYYKQKVILLIDEYDTPIQQSYLNGYYDEFINFMGNILGNALKDNEYLEKGVLTGITRVAKESIFTGVNNLKVSTVLSELFNDKFGLTWKEVEETLRYYGLEYEKEKVIEWYNGYNFGGLEIYNPYSIINLADEKEIKYYWINSSGNALIKQLIRQSTAEVKTKIEELIEGKEIESSIDENLVYGDLDKSTEESIWTLFLFTGYLTWTKHTGEEGEPRYSLKITNKETL